MLNLKSKISIKIIVAILMTTVITGSSVNVSSASPIVIPPNDEAKLENNISKSDLENKTIRFIKQIGNLEKNILSNTDGTFSFDSKIKSAKDIIVDDDVFEAAQNALEFTNTEIKKGNIRPEEVNFITRANPHGKIKSKTEEISSRFSIYRLMNCQGFTYNSSTWFSRTAFINSCDLPIEILGMSYMKNFMAAGYTVVAAYTAAVAAAGIVTLPAGIVFGFVVAIGGAWSIYNIDNTIATLGYCSSISKGGQYTAYTWGYMSSSCQ